MKEFFNKDFGPFDGKTWIVVVIGGLGLGYFIRKRFGTGETANTDDPTIYEVIGTTQPQIVGGGTDYNQGAIVADVIAQLGPRLNPVSPTPDPTNVGNPTGDASDGWRNDFDPANDGALWGNDPAKRVLSPTVSDGGDFRV